MIYKIAGDFSLTATFNFKQCLHKSVSFAFLFTFFGQTGELVELSNQQLIDCSWPVGNHGCRGGFQDRTLRWVKRNGVALRRDYGPYLAQVSGFFKSLASV